MVKLEAPDGTIWKIKEPEEFRTLSIATERVEFGNG
jgi:hypothetical protein